MVDSLLAMVIIGVIVTIVVPTVLAVHSLNQESYEKLEFHRILYLDMKSSEHWKNNMKYRIEERRICHKTKNYCVEIIK